jgi:translation initiation factor IF-2
MSETKTPGEKKLSVSGGKLTLKPRVEQGVVRQSFSHGRTKQVVVEKVKRRAIGGATEARTEPEPVETKRATAPAQRAATPAAPAVDKPKSGVVLRTLTEEEISARAHALADSRVREAEERKAAEEDARRRVARETVDRTEREAAEARKRDEDERRRHDDETKRKADEVARKRLGGEEPAKRPGPAGRMVVEAEEDDTPRVSRRPGGGAARPPARPAVAPRPGAEKQRGRLTVINALTQDEVRERSVASFRRRTQRLKGLSSIVPM